MTMKLSLLGLLILLPAALLKAQQPPGLSIQPVPTPATGPAAQASADIQEGQPTVTLNFPHTSILEILTTYERLTGKKIIRDSNLQGPELSIVVAGAVSQREAVSLIESSLLLNGYTLIPVDGQTVKILGPSHPPRSEGLPLYLEESQLPSDGDKLVSFYEPLKFLSPSEAIAIIDGVIQRNAYGAVTPVLNTSAIVITEKTPVIRKILALLDVVDHEPTQIITEFIPLQRASADKVVETLGQIFGSAGGSAAPAPVAPPSGGGAQGGESVSSGSDTHLLTGKAQFIADKRTNRVLIVVKAENYKYVRDLIAKLDQAVESDQPLIRPLNYRPVSEVLPVLVDMIKGRDDMTNASSASAVGAEGSQQHAPGSSSTSSGGSSSGSVANTPDKLSDTSEENPPESVTVGSVSIMADPSANNIIVYGPPEAKMKASQIIDLLDQRPKQVYLAAVIGQLTLQEGVNYGATWFKQFNNGQGSNNLIAGAGGGLISNVLSSMVSNAVSAGTAGLSGLTIYGTIAQGVSAYANFLESTGKFRTISRPVVYTVNNKKATIFSGQNVPIPGTSTYNTVGAVGTNSLNNVTSTVQYQPVVLKLEVIPLINSDREVNLIIAQHNDKLGAYSNIGGNQVPTILTQELTTTVRVPSGSTIVLGGLISDDNTVNENGIPYINKIPIIGPLLGGATSKQRNRTELVIMIQPIVVDSDETMHQASGAEGGATDLGRKSEEFRKKLQLTPTPTPKKQQWYQKIFEPKKLDNF